MYFLKPPLKKCFIGSLFLAFFVSCEMDADLSAMSDFELPDESIVFDVLEISETESTDQANLRVSGNILHEINFTESDPLGSLTRQFSGSHSFQVVTNPLDPRDKSGKFELRITDKVRTASTNSARAEILLPTQTHNERWYAFSVFFPKEGYATDRLVESISQWHQHGGGSPPNSLEVRDDKIYFRSINRDTKTNVGSAYTNHPLGTVERGKWTEFVFHFVHGSNQNGLIEVWKNGQKTHTIKGPNMRSGFPRPRLKIGVYKWLWNNGQSGGTSRRTLYYDNIKIGNENTVLSEISSNSSTPQPPTENKSSGSGSGTLPEISSFSLIAAGPDEEIGTITAGNAISYKNNKLSVKANIAGNFNGHVKFRLSGGYSYEYTDRTPPYALFGDDGKGDYFFGKGLPPGTYTLTATPIDGNNIGKSKTITFAIRNGKTATDTITPQSPTENEENSYNMLPEISSFSLIAAGPDEEIGIITSGSAISYRNNKLSVKANMAGNFNGDVKFELRGGYSFEYIDRRPPYALFGDDGKGDYFFGRGLPPGTYSLTATPIDGNNIGKSKTITFTIRRN